MAESKTDTAKAPKVEPPRYLRINSMNGKPYTTRVRLIADRTHGHLFPGEIVEVEAADWMVEFDEKIDMGVLAEVPKPKKAEDIRPLRWPSLFEAHRQDPRNHQRTDQQIQADESKLQAAIKNRQAITASGATLRGNVKG